MTSDTSPAAPRLDPVADPHTRLLVRVARMYHEQGLRQAQIAQALHISQPRVSRLLKRASDTGVVRVTVTEPAGVFTDLETQLEQGFGIDEAVVVDTGASADVTAALGAAAAAYLEATLIGGDRIGISSWSATLVAMAGALRPFPQPVATSVTQLVGGIGQSQVQVEANHLLTRLAAATSAEPIFLPAPGVVGTTAAHDAFVGDATVSSVAARWDDLTIALVGIGALDPSPMLDSSGNVLPAPDRQTLSAAGAVGDVCLRYFDVDGAPVASDLDTRVVGITADALRTVPRRIGVAGGTRKAEAIAGALRGGWVNVMIVDAATARVLVGSLA
ncbi:sugar-binding transcriptional regulator [Demequina sp.]|uniref:sugar-binding transcriptional regulator n=1 Tax=Demequina sp. TaxID=2050685 RepID=UPI003A8BF364